VKKALFPILVLSVVLGSLIVATKPAQAKCPAWNILCKIRNKLVQPTISPVDRQNYQSNLSSSLFDVNYEQETNVDCGPHSASRLLKFYAGRENTGVDFYRRLQQYRVDGYSKVEKLFRATDVGTTPHYLKEIIGKVIGSSNDVVLERNVSASRIKRVVQSGHPVLALVRVGSFQKLNTTVPALHWILVVGFDDTSNIVRYYDTQSFVQNGIQKDVNTVWRISQRDFFAQTAGSGNDTFSWSVGGGITSVALESAGATSSTMLWIDRKSQYSCHGLGNQDCFWSPQNVVEFSIDDNATNNKIHATTRSPAEESSYGTIQENKRPPVEVENNIQPTEEPQTKDLPDSSDVLTK
jgi:hypothetical protein